MNELKCARRDYFLTPFNNLTNSTSLGKRNPCAHLVTGFKILSFVQTGVPVQVRPGAPLRIKSTTYKSKHLEKHSKTHGTRRSMITYRGKSTDASLTPFSINQKQLKNTSMTGGSMRYFKHYGGAHGSESLGALIQECGFAGYGRYWILLEYLTEKFDGESSSFRVPSAIIRGLFRIRSWTELDSFAERLSTVRGLNLKRIENVFEIEAPILLELLGRDFKRARTERASSAPKKKSKNKEVDKDKEEERISQKTSLLSNKYFKRISPDNQELLFNSYPLDFLSREIVSGAEWIEKNPLKYMNGEAAFLTSHFGRQWAYQQKVGKKPDPVTAEDISTFIKEREAQNDAG
jgi:hypothetical protein